VAGMSLRAAIDIGGTFTDVQMLDETDGRLVEFKVPTTPSDPTAGLIDGIACAARALGRPVESLQLVMHGTTIATNAVLERRFADCALITTRGFEDVLEIGRHMRRDVYGLYAEERTLLLPRTRRFGVTERVGFDGAVLTALYEDEARELATRISRLGVKAVAICTLHAYANPVHERRLRELLHAVDPTFDVSLSSEVSPEMREYERLSTTVLNALLMPVVRGYMANLERQLSETSPAARVLLVQSNGGVCGTRKAGEQPVGLILSGPSGGALAVEQMSARLGMHDLVGIDMGGTSFDVVVVRQGRAAMASEGSIDGVPVRLPMIELRTIGTGGGSIAWIDDTGRMRVGPRSAGARPGPACYGHGGEHPTVTDANLVLGRIDARRFAGGSMSLDVSLARTAVERGIGRPLGLSLVEAAAGIVAISNANMARAIRLSLYERGLDPGDFALVSFGGAGGLHAVDLAREVGITTVVFPRAAGTFSALGILCSDIVHSLARTRLQALAPAAAGPLATHAAELRAEGDTLLATDGVPPERRRFAFALDLRYRGQGYELTVPLDDGPIDAAALAAAGERFHATHEQRFAHADLKAPVEAVALRLTATGLVPKPKLGGSAPAPQEGTRGAAQIYAEEAWQQIEVYDRAAIGGDARVPGPVLIVEDYSTIFLPRAWQIAALQSGDLVARPI
jgi:N-methylhydantoinase A